MRVIGVDPGYDRLGVAVLELVEGKELLLHSHCIESDRSANLPERLLFLGQAFTRLVNEYQVDTLAIETLFFNQNQKTVMGVAQIRGILIYLAQVAKCRVYEFGPQEVKVALTGYGKSDKKAVIDMVRRLLPSAPTKALDDEYDAIAVAMTCLAHHGNHHS
jgi:crossover junction endodeoxyribonuclease RuvC